MNDRIGELLPKNIRIRLASASPRRRELLSAMGIPFTVSPCDVDEQIGEGTHPADAVILLSARKAQAAAACFGTEDVILSSDTLVEIDGVPLGKPKDEADALSMLLRLSGREHRVHTGLSVAWHGECRTVRDTTRVFMRPFTEEEARAYIATGEPADKAGAYAIQGIASAFIEKIDGDYFNVVGLPTCRMFGLLREAFGIEPEDVICKNNV